MALSIIFAPIFTLYVIYFYLQIVDSTTGLVNAKNRLDGKYYHVILFHVSKIDRSGRNYM